MYVGVLFSFLLYCCGGKGTMLGQFLGRRRHLRILFLYLHMDICTCIYISIQMCIYIYISIYTGGVGHWPQAIKCSGAAFLPQRLENQRRLLPPIFWSPKQIDPSAHTMALEGGWRGFAVEFASTRCLGNDILGGLYVSATCYGLPLLLP